MTDFLKLSQEAYDSSTAFIDANYRNDLNYSIKAFRNEHAPGSKYLSEDYKARSRLFRPKTRSIIRKNEAAGAVAMFSNMEVVNVTPGNPDDIMSVASTEAMKQVLDYRLTHTIPSYEICLGGLQDAQVTGTVVSYQYWEYETKNGKKVKDKPCIELRPIENIRLDAGASWVDPINSSPFFCDIIPMYVCDVRAMMKNEDKKTGLPKWKKFDDAAILKARPDLMDSTRQARLGKSQDPHEEQNTIKAFDIVWVMRWFIRDSQGDDFTYYTLGTEELLTTPKPIDEVYFHGKRPYVMGYCILETHKTFKTGIPMLTKMLQQETNDVANQRIDNVKFVLNKRWLVARGRQVDVQSLVRNVPGGVTLTTDPNNDVKESNWPDVTSSAYVEQDRLNSDFDDLAGNFSPNTKVANNAINDTLGGSKLANQAAGIMTDYLLRTFIETWWEPVLRQLILLEQYYETDEVVLAIAAKKARLFPRFGLSNVTDEMLMNQVHLNVNVGIGSSNPGERMTRFLMAVKAVIELINTAPQSMNVAEMAKEIFSNAGLRDGSRFMSQQEDPRLAKAMQMIQQLQAMVNTKQMEFQAQGQIEQLKLGSNEKIKNAELQIDFARISGDLKIREAELALEQQKLEIEKYRIQLDAMQSQQEAKNAEMELPYRAAELNASLEQAEIKLEGERQKLIGLSVKIAHEIESAKIDLQNTQTTANNEARITETTGQVAESMRSLMGEVGGIQSGMTQALDSMKKEIETMKGGLVLMAGNAITPKRKTTALKLKKADGKKTNAVVVQYDDGSEEEVTVA